MSRPGALVLWCVLAAAPCAAQTPGGQRVKYTVHNLSASGPGAVRAQREPEVCVFCHTPHRGSMVTPLWNRDAPQGPYQMYRSVSMRAQADQPTGTSKLCLSCHDGTIALGNVLSRATPIAMAGGIQTLGPGPSNLGTDLSDDHPVSFSYAASHAGSTELATPEAITPPVRLDAEGQVQCTSCHEPHDNTRGDFLLRDTAFGELCRSCHRQRGWGSSVHATNSGAVSQDVASALGMEAGTVDRNACKCCHRPHHAAGRPWNLQKQNISLTCIGCHDGRVASDIATQTAKVLRHGMNPQGLPSGESLPYVEGQQVSCGDCHNPHRAGSIEGLAPGLPPSLAGVGGVNLSGAPVAVVSKEYELCFRCHGNPPARVQRLVTRSITQDDKRLQFQTNNPSFHPVASAGRNPNVPSLIPGLPATSTIACGDCHASENNRRAGGNAPAGPHGSMYRPLLLARYDTADFSMESSAAYALCYRCHLRDSILGDRSFAKHRRHLDEEQTPCSVCHDPHGINAGQGSVANNSHLINFDRAVVFPNASGRLEFVDGGVFRGACYLRCHDEEHNPKSY